MRRLRLALRVWSIAWAVIAIAPCVRAQEATRLPPAAVLSVAAQAKADAPVGAVRVLVSTDEDDLLLIVALPGKQQAVVSCYHRCSFWGMPGRYTLWATSPERVVHYETTLDVQQRTAFKVSSGHLGARTAGLIAGIAGPIAMVAGAVVAVMQAEECNESSCPRTKLSPVPAALFLGGLTVTISGWMVFALSEPYVDVVDPVDDAPTQPVPPSRDPRLQVGVLAFPRGGWGVGLSTMF
jgi:hypothetical protein